MNYSNTTHKIIFLIITAMRTLIINILMFSHLLCGSTNNIISNLLEAWSASNSLQSFLYVFFIHIIKPFQNINQISNLLNLSHLKTLLLAMDALGQNKCYWFERFHPNHIEYSIQYGPFLSECQNNKTTKRARRLVLLH
jgi:hypothetical protein